jgi:hypothetical protein
VVDGGASFRIFNGYGADIPDVGRSHGHRVLRGADRTYGSILPTGAGRECIGIVFPQGLLRRRKADEMFPAASIRWRGGVR